MFLYFLHVKRKHKKLQFDFYTRREYNIVVIMVRRKEMIEYSEIEAISKSGKGKGMYQASRKMMEHYKMLEKKKICQDIELEER